VSVTAKISRWIVEGLCYLPSLGVIAGVFGLAVFSGRASSRLWSHIGEHILWPALFNSLSIALLTLILSLLLGTFLAWVVVFVKFPGRGFLSAVLALPLAFPAYVLAFIAIGSLDYSGNLATWLRESFQWDMTRVFPVRSKLGMILVLTLSFYPYVFLMAREAFRSQGRVLFEAAQSLGCPFSQAIWRLSIPLARPWIFAGAALVLMETLADFGVASAFNIETLTTSVYKIWLGLFSLAHAAQVALIHLFIVVLFLWLLSKLSKESGGYEDRSGGFESPDAWEPSRSLAWGISFVLFGFWLLVFVAPSLQLAYWAWSEIRSSLDPRLWTWALNAFMMSLSTALLVCFFSFLISYLQRLSKKTKRFQFAKLATLGYAFPGTVLAISFTVLLTLLFGPVAANIPLALGAMLFALSIRFFAVGFHPIFQAMKRIPNSMDEAAQTLGLRSFGIFRRIHLPLLGPSLGGALLFVFMDCLKEMPIHVMMRPFGWDTLAVRIFDFTREGEWERAALPSLLILFISFPAALWISLRTRSRRYKEILK
jgi:iron(III) transport system permease protein